MGEFEQNELQRSATKALEMLAKFLPFSDEKPAVNIDRVNRTLTASDINSLVQNEGMDGAVQERGVTATTRVFNVPKLEELAGKTLGQVRADIAQQR